MAVENNPPSVGESAQARPVQTASRGEPVRLRTHAAATRTVRPNAAACR